MSGWRSPSCSKPVRELGGAYDIVLDCQPFAVANGRLVTGTNPALSVLTPKLAIDALKAR
ncbi:hypothetical protein [Asaia krungthepensis]|uniref:Glucose-methanol-choline oxidoreductase C-terminal domain-containing protein n=1 Tax=Asaia krungthepensis NRIC 0535 TaxID=1307925 RepID=A0ABQ0Q2P9_9PROT|nr:hypothetical protein [Asaia krungthepensis]GBQ88490.1 hypothetical protein AA0535_1553 [Asaia krungthepensis NRIC 0535]